MTKHEDDIIKCAIKWWRGHRPYRFNKQQHLKNPTINTTNHREMDLALAIGEYYKNKKEGVE